MFPSCIFGHLLATLYCSVFCFVSLCTVGHGCTAMYPTKGTLILAFESFRSILINAILTDHYGVICFSFFEAIMTHLLHLFHASIDVVVAEDVFEAVQEGSGVGTLDSS